MKTTQESDLLRETPDAVRNGYSSPGSAMVSDGSSTGSSDNLLRLKVIVSLFGLNLGDIGKVCKVSRPYVSRVLSGDLKPSSRFLRSLELNLHSIIEHRHGQVFTITVTQPPESLMSMSAAKNITAPHL